MAKNDDVVRENAERFTYMRDNGHLTFVTKADRCDRYFLGEQWEENVKRRLNRLGRPALTINKTLATMAVVMGEQLNNRADIGFRPMRGGTPEVASALNKVYISIANNNKLDWVESTVADDGFITSRGFYDVRIDYNDQMQGEVRIKALNPRNVLVDPDAEEYDPHTWKDVIITKWLTLSDIELTYGADKAKEVSSKGDCTGFEYDFVDRSNQTFAGFFIPPTNPGSGFDDTNTSRKYRVVERQHKRIRYVLHFVDPVTGDIRAVPDNWSNRKVKTVAAKAGVELIRKRVERIRWTVTTYNTVLHDDWSPYQYFTVVPYFPFFRHGKTVGLVEGFLDGQDLLNKSLSQELHILNTTANSGWKVKKGSLTNMTTEELEERGAETGIVMELDDIGNAEKILPNSIPSGHDRMTGRADEFIKEVSGVSDSMRGFDRADVAAKAITAKRQAGSVNLAKPMDNLARTRHMLAVRVLSLVQLFYTEERIIQITGKALGAPTEELPVNKVTPEGEIVNNLTLGEYDVTVTTVPARATYEETQFQQAVQLRELGVQIPDSVIIKSSTLDDKEEVLQSSAPSPEQQQEQQRIKDLDLREREAEIKDKEASAMERMAQAELAKAKAERELADIQAGKLPAAQQTPAQGQQGDQDVTKIADFLLRKKEMKQRMQLERERFDFDKEDRIHQRMAQERERLDRKLMDRRPPQQTQSA